MGLETSLAATLTELYHTGRITLNKVVSIMSANPRRILGLDPIEIKAGTTADLILADIDREWTVIPGELHSKSKNSVFKGEKLRELFAC